MKSRILLAVVLGLAVGAVVAAQDQTSAPPAPQNGARFGPSGGPGVGGMGMMGRGITGTVTQEAAGRFTIKTFQGEIYTVDFGDNTRMMKMQGGMAGRGMRGGGGGMGRRGMRGNPPEPIKASDIKVGDAIAARGEINASEKTVGAVTIMLLDPQMAQRMQQMAAEYGKTWLMGWVTAINGTTLTLLGNQDNSPHSFVVNENTEFRERRNPITLADVKVGDMVRVQGALNDRTFTAADVNVMRMGQGRPNSPGSTYPAANQ